MRILVTGSSGFIGPHLVEALIDQGHYVVGLDRKRPVAYEPHVFVHGDLVDEGPLEKALTYDVDCIAHLAAARADWGLTPTEYFRDNVVATQRVIEAGAEAEVRKWVLFSTVGVFGPSSSPLGDTAPLAPQGTYGFTKARSEQLFDEMSLVDPDNQVTVLRPSAVYGPGNPPNTNVYRLIDAIHRKRFVMIGPGENTKTVSYLPNLIEATLFLMDRMTPGVSKFIYVDSPALTTKSLVEEIHEILGRKEAGWSFPLPLAKALAYPVDLVARLTNVDLPITSARIQKFSRSTNFARTALDDMGFTPTYSNQQALQATVDWYMTTVASI